MFGIWWEKKHIVCFSSWLEWLWLESWIFKTRNAFATKTAFWIQCLGCDLHRSAYVKCDESQLKMESLNGSLSLSSYANCVLFLCTFSYVNHISVLGGSHWCLRNQVTFLKSHCHEVGDFGYKLTSPSRALYITSVMWLCSQN